MRSTRVPRTVALGAAALVALAGCAISDDTGDRTKLTFWSYYQGTQADWLDERVEAFESDHPDVDIEIVETVGDQQDQRLLASVATGSTPDLFINNIVVDYPTLQASGVFADLTGYWDDYADRDQFADAAVWETDGAVYNLLPFTNLIGLYANTDILGEVGIDEIPTDLDGLEAALEAVRADGRYDGIALSGAPDVEGAWLFAPQLLGLGIGYCEFDGPEVDAAFDRVERWAKAGYTPQATATWSQTDAWEQFATGRYAFGINGNWNLGNAQEVGFSWETAQYPAPASGQSVVYPGGEGFGIGATSEHKDLAWQFLEEQVLASEGGASIFETAGSIPIRADVAELPELKENVEVQPFIAAAQSAANWPDNENTAAIQNALGKAVSGVISGQIDGATGAANATSEIAAAIEEGGGTC